MIKFSGPGELSVFPTIPEMDREVSALLRMAVSVLRPGSSNKAVHELIDKNLTWPTVKQDKSMPRYRKPLRVQEEENLEVDEHADHSGEFEFEILPEKYHYK